MAVAVSGRSAVCLQAAPTRRRAARMEKPQLEWHLADTQHPNWDVQVMRAKPDWWCARRGRSRTRGLGVWRAMIFRTFRTLRREEENFESRLTAILRAVLMPGVRANLHAVSFQIVQTSKVHPDGYEFANATRTIYMAMRLQPRRY